MLGRGEAAAGDDCWGSEGAEAEADGGDADGGGGKGGLLAEVSRDGPFAWKNERMDSWAGGGALLEGRDMAMAGAEEARREKGCG